jgi:NADP-dependent 3-hydroxy acid dehydrogenase YdfG
VTGAASGIGLASTEAMLAAGSRVVMVDRDESALKALYKKHGDAVIPLVIDLLNPKDCATLLRESWRRQANSTSCMRMLVRTSAETWSMPTRGLSTGC